MNDDQKGKFIANTDSKFYGLWIHHKQFQKTMRSADDVHLISV